MQALTMWLYPCVIKEIFIMSLMCGNFSHSRAHFTVLSLLIFLGDAGTCWIQGRGITAPKTLAGCKGVGTRGKCPRGRGDSGALGSECIKSFSAFVLWMLQRWMDFLLLYTRHSGFWIMSCYLSVFLPHEVIFLFLPFYHFKKFWMSFSQALGLFIFFFLPIKRHFHLFPLSFFYGSSFLG